MQQSLIFSTLLPSTVLGILSACLLSACTSNNELFDCPAGKGAGCKSISEVNRMVDEGQFGGNREDSASSLKPLAPIALSSEEVSAFSPLSSVPIERIPEQNLRLWIAPFQDEAGNLYEESAIHTVVQQGRWKFKSEV
ncbi:MAG: TraV family lipoprotein [Alphaproteobacteria bacterium]|nr:TraV family lipoprotein [Alphaproteobacteria bacterium]